MSAKNTRNTQGRNADILTEKQLDTLLELVAFSRNEIKKMTKTGNSANRQLMQMYHSGMLTKINDTLSRAKNQIHCTCSNTVEVNISKQEKQGLGLLVIINTTICRKTLEFLMSDKEVGIWDEEAEKMEKQFRDKFNAIADVAGCIFDAYNIGTIDEIGKTNTDEIIEFRITKGEVDALYNALEQSNLTEPAKSKDEADYIKFMDSVTNRVTMAGARMENNNTDEDVLKIRKHEIESFTSVLIYYFSRLTASFELEENKNNEYGLNWAREIENNLISFGDKIIGEVYVGDKVVCKKDDKEKIKICKDILKFDDSDSGLEEVEISLPDDVIRY